MSNQEHVCIAITKSNMGGAQKYVLILADELQKRGMQITVLAGGDGLLFEELRKRNISFIKLKNSQRDISLLTEFKLCIELFSILKQIKPIALHLNSSKLGVVGAIIGRLAKIKKIFFTAHGWAFNEVRPKWQLDILRIFYWLAILFSTKTICVSNQTKQQISDLPFIKNKLIVIRNGIPVPYFYTQEEARNSLKALYPELNIQKKWIVVLAELHYTKGHDILMSAISEITQDIQEYQFICIGEGERQGKLKALVHHKNLEKYVLFTGFVPNASTYLRAFDCLILPSRTEALPLCILEAGLAKINVIASCVGGIPEIIEDTVSGLLFEKENIQHLKEKILTYINLSDTEKKDMQNRLENKIKKDFSIEQMINETDALYHLN